MRIRLLLFALYRDLAGTSELDVELPSGATAAMLVDAVRRRGGGWARIPAGATVAVNQEYVPPDTPLADGDEVALIPPVAGG